MLAPAAGSALVFGGTVTHAGQPISEGERTVFVASFSLKRYSCFVPFEEALVATGCAVPPAAAARTEQGEECTAEELCAALEL